MGREYVVVDFTFICIWRESTSHSLKLGLKPTKILEPSLANVRTGAWPRKPDRLVLGEFGIICNS